MEERVIFCREGVFLHATVHNQDDDDSLVPGRIIITEKAIGTFIEWNPVDIEYDVSDNQNTDAEWAVINAVSQNSHSETVTFTKDSSSVSGPHSKATVSTHNKPPRPHKQIINFDITDLKSFKRSNPSLGWSYIHFLLKDGTTYPALHFHQGGTTALIKHLEKYLSIKRSANNSQLYLVRKHDPGALHKSFDELQLFGDSSADLVSKFIKDPYSTTLGGFSKVTNFLNLLVADPNSTTRPREEEVVNMIQEELPGVDINNKDEPGFEMITCASLPPRQDVTREDPLSPQEWSKHMKPDGQITDIEKLKQKIFRGGVDPSIRIEVWKFLLDYYSWESTYKSRIEERKKKVDDYFRMKLQWKSISSEQEKRFSQVRDRKSLIEKDVNRTDRTHVFFQGENNPNLQVLNDVLMTYCMYNFDLGYVQGMSDLLAPILVVMENEVDAFWCFAGYMEIMCSNFEMDQQGMKDQLSRLHTLIQFIDPQLCNHLESHESSNMYFCFRWLLIMFKREFSFPQIMRLWEVHWTGLPGPNFHLLICIAILDTEKNTLIDNGFGFTEILKHINDMSGTINLEETLCKAESIYLQLVNCTNLPKQICEIIGRETTDRESESGGSSTRMNGGATPAGTPGSISSTPSNSQQMIHGTGTPPDDDDSLEFVNNVDKTIGMWA
ncbi:TBC1 domain family member 15-like [Tubulanus polymorphus]|uniref:TBC1 domain family member 15-like n=1 Tax=Tubulanus polymorphus TaxID=672921 RepID=UPI003DA33326